MQPRGRAGPDGDQGCRTEAVRTWWRGLLQFGWICRSLESSPADNNPPGMMNERSDAVAFVAYLRDAALLPETICGRAGGGFFMPRRNTSPVSRCFQLTEMR